MAHVYTLGAIHGEPGAEELVDKALDGLRGPLHDDVNGGWYPSITADGTPEAARSATRTPSSSWPPPRPR